MLEEIMDEIQKEIVRQEVNKPVLAEELGVSRSVLYAWLKGTKIPSVGHLEELLAALGLRLAVVSASGSQNLDSSHASEPLVDNILSTHSSQIVNQRFIEQQLDGLKGSIASILSNTEKILESCEPVADTNEPLVENEPQEDSGLQVESQPEVDSEPLVDSSQPEGDSRQKSRKRKQKPKRHSNTPSYVYNGIKGSIREHLLRELPDLSSKDINRARNNINRRMRGRPDKKNARTYPPEEAIALELKKLKKGN